ncbi:zinc finger, CCHC-type containing protein [Tanacetum coccineum]|uniref:Zinc finger, CCHC-type containing protein n=1 Tax=Tanacetum coccineum TaxID=301880 RepID=A0ABQ5FAS4_9ASTR
MSEEDEDKTAFYAGERVFCYKKMPFGLKNAGTTYQRFVNKRPQPTVPTLATEARPTVVSNRPQPTTAGSTADRSRPQPVMTIDKSWTTISNRNSEEFLDGLFAFIKHCKPLLHPITQKIHCPCSRCCNRDDNRVTLEILEVHISRYGFDQHYTTWKYHGEPILPLPPQVPHSPEHVDMDTFFEDISANNVPTPPTQTTGPQPFQTTGPNNEFEDDDVAHVLDDDDDVVVSDDDEVNPSTNVEEVLSSDDSDDDNRS